MRKPKFIVIPGRAGGSGSPFIFSQSPQGLDSLFPLNTVPYGVCFPPGQWGELPLSVETRLELLGVKGHNVCILWKTVSVKIIMKPRKVK